MPPPPLLPKLRLLSLTPALPKAHLRSTDQVGRGLASARHQPRAQAPPVRARWAGLRPTAS
jgi:hypothetical protein